jgi:branched-chain amino acid transport system ATP-binding protein
MTKPPDTTGPVLVATGIGKRFGGLQAVQGVSLEAHAGRIVSVIGPNGAGKTTFFNCLSGIYRPEAGTVRLAGRDLVGLKPHQISHAGLARSFQNIRLFPEMTALQNVLVGRYAHTQAPLWKIVCRTPGYLHQERAARDRAMELLEFVELSPRAGDWARSLPYGLQRRLEVARALATDPQVLLLDEPGAGMNPSEIVGMMDLVRRIAATGVAVVVIEHHMKLVMEISDHILVLDHGEPIAEGAPEQVRSNPRVLEAYLGAEAAA